MAKYTDLQQKALRKAYDAYPSSVMGGRYGEVSIASCKSLVKRGLLRATIHYGGAFIITEAGQREWERITDTSPNAVTRQEVQDNAFIVQEFLDYLRWLDDKHPDMTLTVNTVWRLYHAGVRECILWEETCENLGLPVRERW